MQAPASNYPVTSRPSGEGAGWGGPSDAPTRITQGRSSLTVTLHLEDGSGRTFRLQRGSNLLGRGQDAAFRLPDTGVRASTRTSGSTAERPCSAIWVRPTAPRSTAVRCRIGNWPTVM